MNRNSLTRDEQALGLIAWIVVGVVGLVGALGATGGILYATDFAVDATVIDKDCSTVIGSGENSISVKTKLFGIEHTLEDVPADQCQLIQKDNFVSYRIKSERTSIWGSEGGNCIWDTVHGAGGCDK